MTHVRRSLPSISFSVFSSTPSFSYSRRLYSLLLAFQRPFLTDRNNAGDEERFKWRTFTFHEAKSQAEKIAKRFISVQDDYDTIVPGVLLSCLQKPGRCTLVNALVEIKPDQLLDTLLKCIPERFPPSTI